MSVTRIMAEIQRRAAKDGIGYAVEIRFTDGSVKEFDFYKAESGFLILSDDADEGRRDVFVPFDAVSWVRPIWL